MPGRFPGRAASALRAFPRQEAAGGIVLIAAALLALAIANSPCADAYFAALHFETGPVLNPKLGPMSVHLWINDALMAVFFLRVGLEIKRELVKGQLASRQQRRLPFIAAAAGMIVPALVYLAVTRGERTLQPGWAIPAATDIAFAMGVLALLGKHVPNALKLFLTTVAIVDDLGAVAIIAVAYTEQINTLALAGAALVAVILYALNRGDVMKLWPYLAGFALLWLLVLLSGVHATIAGVLAAMLIPSANPGAPGAASPLVRLEHALHPWVAFGIVPIFAFANAGVAFSGMTPAALLEPLVLGITLGLLLGKQIGIFGGIWIAERLGIAKRPAEASWTQIYGMALIAGIGFTMSLFIGGLAFPPAAGFEEEVKLGVLAGSLLSGATGFLILRFAGRSPPPAG